MEKSEAEMRNIRGAKISMIFQDPSTALNPVYTVGNQIVEAITLHQALEKAESWQEAVNLMKLVGIASADKRMKDFPHEFSGGMQQRVMIAISLSCQPELLIADEPTTNLDVTIQAQILDLMKSLQNKFGTSILLITHDLGIIAEMCDRVGVMYAGHVVEIADTISIFDKPMHPYTNGLLLSIPKITERKEFLDTIPGAVPRMIDPPSGCPFHPRCKFQTKICVKEFPPIEEVEPGHLLACYNPLRYG